MYKQKMETCTCMEGVLVPAVVFISSFCITSICIQYRARVSHRHAVRTAVGPMPPALAAASERLTVLHIGTASAS